MNTKTTLALLSTSGLTAGITQAQVVSSGTINLEQDYNASGNYRTGVSITGGSTPDFAFGYDAGTTANAQKPYVDARSNLSAPLGNMQGTVGAITGNVSLLAMSNNGFPLTAAGTLIDATYAATYPALTASSPDAQRGYFFNEAGNNLAGAWGNTALVDGYVGIIVNGDEYGYLHFLDNPNTSLTLEDWAYQSTPGVGIVAGSASVVPEPSSIGAGAVAAGTALVALFRRRQLSIPAK
jgi:hypothetical protein